MIEKAVHARKLLFAFDHQPALLGSSSAQGTSSGMSACRGETLQFGEQRTVLRLGPRLDCALVQRLGFVRNDQIEIEVDGVAETLAARAGAVRIVEGKQARLRLLVAHVAVLALEALRKA